MSKIKVKAYYPCNYPLLKAIVKSGTIGVPRTYFLDMAKELCEFYGESFDAFVDSANGTRLLNDGIDNCYSNIWLSSVTLHKSAKSVVHRFIEVSEKIYDKIRLWIARVKKCKLADLPVEWDIHQKYISGKESTNMRYYFIMYAVTDKQTSSAEFTLGNSVGILWVDEMGNSGSYSLNDIKNI